MPTITPANIRALTERLVRDGTLDKPDMDALVDAALGDKVLSRSERDELRQVLSQHADKIDAGETRARLEKFLAIENAGVRNLAHSLEREGGTIDASDARALVDMVGQDGNVSGREKYSLGAALIAHTMTDEAKVIVRGAIDGGATPTAPTPTAPTPTTSLFDLGLPEVDGRKFSLSSAGFFTADGKSPTFDAAGAESFYQAADALTRVGGGVLKSVPTATKAALIETLHKAFVAGKETSSLPDVSRQKIRAAAGAMLLQVIEGAGSADSDVKKQALKLYFEQAMSEPMHGLRASMFFNLERIQSTLGAADKVRLSDLEKVVLPQKPPYEKWFADGDRTIEMKHYAHQECWIHSTDPITQYQSKGFKLVESHENERPPRWILEKTNPSAPGGEVKARVEVIQSHDGIFQEMDDPNVNMILYTGHSNLGGNVSEELRLGTPEKSEKLIMLAMCRGKQNMFEVANKYPSSHFVTTDEPSYFSSVMPMTLGMVEGALNLKSYAEMKRDTPRIWDTNQNDNYFYPHEAKRYAHYDVDKDGVIDSRGAHVDRLYDVALKMPSANRTDGVVHPTALKAEELDGTKVLHAVQFLNTLMTYHVDHGHHTSAFKAGDMDNFLSAGWFDGPASEKIRLEKNPDGKIEVRVNKGLADQSWYVLGTILQFEVTRMLLKERNGGTLTKEDEARAALFAGEYLAYMYCSLDEAVAGIRAVARDSEHLAGVSYQDLHEAISSDGHGYVTDVQMKALLADV